MRTEQAVYSLINNYIENDKKATELHESKKIGYEHMMKMKHQVAVDTAELIKAVQPELIYMPSDGGVIL